MRQTTPTYDQAQQLLQITGLMIQQHHQETEYQRAEAYYREIARSKIRLHSDEHQRAEAYRELTGRMAEEIDRLREEVKSLRELLRQRNCDDC